jgi:hypothetical protein
VDEDSNELVARLCTAVGIIMEDTAPLAISRTVSAGPQVEESLEVLEAAARDIAALVRAAQVAAHRNIR